MSPPPPESVAARFVLRSSDRDWELYPGDTLVGRGESCDVVLEDSSVSRRHAVLHVDDDGVRVEDLGSSNGTFVNGVRVSGRATLDAGDRLMIGSYQLGFAEKGQSRRREKRTQPMPNRSRSEPAEQRSTSDMPGGTTGSHSMHGMLVQAADRAFAAGDVDSAAFAVTNLFVSVRASLVRKTQLEGELLAALERQTLKLLELTRQPHWLDQLLRTLEQVGSGVSPETANRIQELAERFDLSSEQLKKLSELMRR